MIDEITVAVFVACGIGLVAFGLNQLLQRDRQAGLDNKCPPHKWAWNTEREMEDVNGYRGYLECAKCKRRPDGLQDKGWGTWPTFPTA